MGAGLPKDVLGSCREPQTIGQTSKADSPWGDDRAVKDDDEFGGYPSSDGHMCHGAHLLPWEQTTDFEQLQGGCCGVLAQPVLQGGRKDRDDGRTRMEVSSSLSHQQPSGIAGFPVSPGNSPRGMSSMLNTLAPPSISRTCGGDNYDRENEIPIDQPLEVSRPGLNIAADTADGNVIYMSNDGRTMWLENPPEINFGGEVKKT